MIRGAMVALLGVLTLGTLAMGTSAQAQDAVADFYKGKQIRIVAASAAGGGPGSTSTVSGSVPPYAATAASRLKNGPRSTSVSRNWAVDVMIAFARGASATPGSSARI